MKKHIKHMQQETQNSKDKENIKLMAKNDNF